MNMFKRKNGVLAFLLVAVMLLGVGFAALTDTLTITGTATVDIDETGTGAQTVFEEAVYFTAVTESVNATQGVTAKNSTTLPGTNVDAVEFTVTGFDKKDDTASITYTIMNDHDDLSAKVTVKTFNNGANEYFTVTQDWPADGKIIAAGDTADVTIKVVLAKSTIDDKSATIGLTFDVEAVEPGT